MEKKKATNLDIKEIQNVSFQILLLIAEICDKLQLKYVLAYGTLIGAVRHKGYIPWDDDVDIQMPRPDFEKLVKYFDDNKEALLPYKLLNRTNTPNYPYLLTRIVDSRYTLDVKNENPCGMGIFVDIYTMDGAGNSLKDARNLLSKTKWYVSCIFLSTRKSLRIDGTKGYIKRCIKPFFYLYVKLKGTNYFVNKLYNLIQKLDYEKSTYIANLEWDNTNTSAMKKTDIENRVEVSFNGHSFWAPANYHQYLTSIYGDYMKLPPERDRVYHHLYKAYNK